MPRGGALVARGAAGLTLTGAAARGCGDGGRRPTRNVGGGTKRPTKRASGGLGMALGTTTRSSGAGRSTGAAISGAVGTALPAALSTVTGGSARGAAVAGGADSTAVLAARAPVVDGRVAPRGPGLGIDWDETAVVKHAA